MGQALATTRFYLHGKKHFTSTGYEAAEARFLQSGRELLEDIDMADRVCMITGANSGIGKELSRHLASRNAKVYMVCRNEGRGEAARQEIQEATGNRNVHLLLGDVSLKDGIEKVVNEFSEKEENLHCLVCNAGALLNERTLTKDGFETTFAAHLLFGTYYLSKRLAPSLSKTPGSRLIIVSSGGMYNSKFPVWEKAVGNDGYDGQMAYVYAKRGQVLLGERWAAEFPFPVTVCHPGWVATPGVSAAYGSKQSWLEPLRTMWQGTEGIAWLCTSPVSQLVSGAFYLDREEQPKHFTGSTSNTESEVDFMMEALELAAETNDPNARVGVEGSAAAKATL